jgi:hypothetical protein
LKCLLDANDPAWEDSDINIFCLHDGYDVNKIGPVKQWGQCISRTDNHNANCIITMCYAHGHENDPANTSRFKKRVTLLPYPDFASYRVKNDLMYNNVNVIVGHSSTLVEKDALDFLKGFDLKFCRVAYSKQRGLVVHYPSEIVNRHQHFFLNAKYYMNMWTRPLPLEDRMAFTPLKMARLNKYKARGFRYTTTIEDFDITSHYITNEIEKIREKECNPHPYAL